MSKFRLSVRARILAIALIPSGVLLAGGVGASTYLAVEAFGLRDEAAQLKVAVEPALDFSETLQNERRLSLRALAGDQAAARDLAGARARVDEVMTSPALLEAQYTIVELADGDTSLSTDDAGDVVKAFGQVRQGIDAGLVPADQVYQFYGAILDRMLTGTRVLANALPDPKAVAQAGVTFDLFDAAESMARGNALAVAVVDNMTPTQLHEFTQQVGAYRTRITRLTPSLSEPDRARMATLTNGAAWRALNGMENAIIERGIGRTDPLPLSKADWQAAVDSVSSELLDMYHDQHTAVVDGAISDAESTATWWLVGAVAMLAAAVLASLATLRISGHLIRRLKRLRAEALAMADEHLPRIMTRLRNGEDVDVTTELRPLDFGEDEIGDVADAFNRAESAAVSAAVEEAKTRGGINSLFLNIAHRSQIVVHRQLELLDRAEHSEEDPTRLAMLFELDHLSTRARRNAENLIILGGEQPGRQWRNPVPLVELVRSAIAETEDYARVHTGQMAGVSVVGSVVADLIHLIAELVENATSFSPPESRVNVTGSVVGRGAVVEVTDQGLGMSAEQLAQANETLREPPNFSMANLSSDSRMGLLVVGQIAARNGVSVRLSDSDYGGVRAIVLIPMSLIVTDGGRPTGAPVPVGVSAGTGVAEAHVGAPRNGSPFSTGVSAVPWPTVDEPTTALRHPPRPEARATPREPASAQPPGRSVTDSQHGIQPTAGRPALPRRRRQESMSPQLTNAPQQPQPKPSGGRARSAEHVRDLFAEIESGTRKGRQTRPGQETNHPDGREGQW